MCWTWTENKKFELFELNIITFFNLTHTHFSNRQHETWANFYVCMCACVFLSSVWLCSFWIRSSYLWLNVCMIDDKSVVRDTFSKCVYLSILFWIFLRVALTSTNDGGQVSTPYRNFSHENSVEHTNYLRCPQSPKIWKSGRRIRSFSKRNRLVNFSIHLRMNYNWNK